MNQLDYALEEAEQARRRQEEMERLRLEQLRNAENLIQEFMGAGRSYHFVTNPELGHVSVPLNQQVPYIKEQMLAILAEIRPTTASGRYEAYESRGAGAGYTTLNPSSYTPPVPVPQVA